MLRPLATTVIALCIVCASWYLYKKNDSHEADISQQVRHAMVQHQHAEQRLKKLDRSTVSPILGVLGEDMAAVQIRIAEYLNRQYRRSAGSDHQLVYRQSVHPQSLSTRAWEDLPDTTISAIEILRLDVQLKLAHAQEFINLLHDINAEVGGWPVEVRACDMQRLPDHSLSIRCVMDIYHWRADIHETSEAA